MGATCRRTWTISAFVVAAIVTAAPSAVAAGAFWYDDASIHEHNIEGVQAASLLRGCDPPANSRACPTDAVSRGQMAAFIARALDLAPPSSDHFRDDDGSTFEYDINRIAEAGITVGCNPPDSTRFCPDLIVDRGQMAAFLARGYELPPADEDSFRDDDGSVFESVIDRMAAAGITVGCNPPDSTLYCPEDDVLREQMASFLVRADDGLVGLDPWRLRERTITYDVRRAGADVSEWERVLLSRRAAEALYAEVGWNIRHRLLIQEVSDPGDFTLWLTDADLVDEQAPVCSEEYSCTVGDDIYINRRNFVDRPGTWQGRGQDEYQRYLVMHEVGHWLDFDDTADTDDPSHYNDVVYCVAGAAPVMKQQSIRLDGCSTNVYPLPFERDCVEEAWIADTTDQGDGDGDDDDQCPHVPTER